MIVLYWYARGVGNSDSRVALKKIRSHKPLLIFIVEPMISFSHFRKRCDFPNYKFP